MWIVDTLNAQVRHFQVMHFQLPRSHSVQNLTQIQNCHFCSLLIMLFLAYCSVTLTPANIKLNLSVFCG